MALPVSRRFVIDMYSSRHPLWSMPEPDVERIRAALPAGWEVMRTTEEADGSGDGVPRSTPELLAAIRDAEVYCGFGISRALFVAAKALRWVHSGSAGVGGSLFPEMVESDVIFTNSAGVHAVPVAEHAIAMMFHFARGFDRVAGNRRERRWGRDRLAGVEGAVGELTGARLGVIGYGGIGRAVADRARALGMEVVALRRRPRPTAEEGVRVLGLDGLGEVLGGSDYIVLALPHTAATDRLIGAEELNVMKPGAVLINIARGELVDEEALAEALRSGRLRGAGLDVFREEPLPDSSPLWYVENAHITPHVAGVSPRYWDRETELILENIGRYLAGATLLNRVDKEAGY